MEISLIIVLFITLLIINNSTNSKLDKIEGRLRDLQRNLEFLKRKEQGIEKEIESVEKVPIQTKQPVVTPPIPEPEVTPVVPPPIIEPPKEVKEIIKTAEKTAPIQADKKPVDTYEVPKPKPVVTPRVPHKSSWEKFKEKNPDLEKFIGENLINKIGILILVLGISYFVKYAIDKDWINEPARVGIGILCGGIVMAVAHKLRKNYAAFSSVLVAGAFAIFYFTISIAFHDYHLFSQTVAFSIMVVITAFSALISLSYNRIELAILTLIGGFAAPFIVSTGQGNYIVLFTYIMILDVGILALAYYRKWNLLTLLAYIFTSILYIGWLSSIIGKENAPYYNAMLFATGFYLIFILITLINNMRTKGLFTTMELVLLTSNTFVYYAIGMAILNRYHPELNGLFTTLLGLFNLIYAWFLYKKFGADKTVIYLLIGLTLTFITLAIPIQFKGNQITLFWAGEAVLLMWLAQKSKINNFRFASVLVHLLMLISLIMDWSNIYNSDKVLNIILNPAFISGAVSLISLFAVRYILSKETENCHLWGIRFNPQSYSNYLQGLALVMLYFIGMFEISYQAHDYITNDYSAASFSVVYHLLFSVVFVHFYCKNNTNTQLAALISTINIIVYAFAFTILAFKEQEDYLSSTVILRIGFILHYISLACIIYFGYILYNINQKRLLPSVFNAKLYIWVVAFFIVYIASSEVMLHCLVLSTEPVTAQQALSDPMYQSMDYNKEVLMEIAVEKLIASTRIQIIKIAYPILWGVIAFLFLIIGIKKQWKSLRIISLVLLGITIFKLFVYDIRNVSETGKIVAFILLGVLILIISFVYQKIKVLVLDDPTKNSKTEPDEKV